MDETPGFKSKGERVVLMSDQPMETSPHVAQLIGAITMRMEQLGEAGNFGDSGLLWQCHRVIEGMRLELGRLRALVPVTSGNG